MSIELFMGSLIVLTFVAVFVVLTTTQKRVEYSKDDQKRPQNVAAKRPRSDQKA